MIEDELAFLDDIAADPENDFPRLMYADWLAEQGDPREELIRVQVELGEHPRIEPPRHPLAQREKKLLPIAKVMWRDWLRDRIPGLMASFGIGFERGVPAVIEMFSSEHRKHREELANWCPTLCGWREMSADRRVFVEDYVRSIQTEQRDGSGVPVYLRDLIESPSGDRLELFDDLLPINPVSQLLAKRTPPLRVRSCRVYGTQRRSIRREQELFESESFSGLRRLEIVHPAGFPKKLVTMIGGLVTLKTLSLRLSDRSRYRGPATRTMDLAGLAQPEAMTELEQFAIWNADWTGNARDAVSRITRLPSLRSLTLRGCNLSADDLQPLLHDSVPRLRFLDLRENPIDREFIQTLRDVFGAEVYATARR